MFLENMVLFIESVVLFIENMVLFIESVVLFVSIYTQPLYCTTVDNHVLLRYEFNYVQSVDAS